MYQFYNAHPKGLIVGDCVKRAISKAANMDYHQVQLELNRYKKVTGARYFNSDRNPDRYVSEVLKAQKLSFPAQKGKPRMNGIRFCQSYAKGSYILQMAGHWSCCIDGVIYDTWDCSEKCVYTAWKLPQDRNTYTVRLHYKGSLCDQDIFESETKEEAVKKLRADFEVFLSKIDSVKHFEVRIENQIIFS